MVTSVLPNNDSAWQTHLNRERSTRQYRYVRVPHEILRQLVFKYEKDGDVGLSSKLVIKMKKTK